VSEKKGIATKNTKNLGRLLKKSDKRRRAEKSEWLHALLFSAFLSYSAFLRFLTAFPFWRFTRTNSWQ
jgi:hypothetical protein